MTSGTQEIERRFLVDELPPGLDGAEFRLLRQGYLPGTDEELHLRLRTVGGRFFLTVKHGRGVVRTEVEVGLMQSQFDALWPLTEGRRLEKRRHTLVEGRTGIDVDVFLGPLDGLVLAEVEFAALEDAAAFAPPAWLGPEVTADARYSSASLALSQRIPEPALL